MTSKRRRSDVWHGDNNAWLSTTSNDPTGEALIASGIVGWIYSRLPRWVQVAVRRRVRLVVVAMWLPVFVFLIVNAWTQCSPR